MSEGAISEAAPAGAPITGCLAGVKVIDFTNDSGRFATKLLTEMGADVLRISADGSPGQPLSDPAAAEFGGVLDWWYDGGKRRHVIDIATASGQDAYRQLAQSADVIIETQHPGALAELGIDYQDLAATNAQLVQISLTPFGRTGPRAGWASSDLVSAAMGGILSLTGTPERPLNVWGWQAYNFGGYVAATSALSGLLAARRTGQGAHVDLSIHEVVCGSIENLMMQYFFDDFIAAPAVAPRQGALHWLRVYDLAKCGDGVIMITPTPDPQALFAWMIETGFEEVRKWVGVETIDLLAVIDEVMDAIRRWVEPFDAKELWWEAQSRHIAFGGVLDIAEVCENPQFAYRGFWTEVGSEVSDASQPAGASQEAEGASASQPSLATPLKMPGRFVRWSGQGNAGVVPSKPPATGDEALEEVLADWRARDRISADPDSADQANSDPADPAPANSDSADQANSDPANSDRRPLDGIRIADFTWVLAGPSATKMLGDLGADVIRIQSEEHATIVNSPEHPYYFTWSRSKRSATIDMSHPRALEAARRLIEQCDVLMENFSAGVLASWGLDWETVHSWNPRLVYVTMSGCGHDGPWHHVISYAPTVHAVCGITHLTNFADRSDIGSGFSLNDHLAGFAGAVSAIAALAGRDRTGQGQLIDMAQLEIGTYNIAPAVIQQLAGVSKPVVAGNADGMAGHTPNEVFRCADDNFVAITATCDEQWQSLVEVVAGGSDAGGPASANSPASADSPAVPDSAASADSSAAPDSAALHNPELATQPGRAANKDQIDAVLASWATQRSAAQAAEQLQAVGVPAGPVQTSEDLVLNDPQHAAREYWQPVEHGFFGPRTVDAFAALWNGQRWWPRHLSPQYLGEHNFEVWTELAGYDFEEVAELTGDGLFR